MSPTEKITDIFMKINKIKSFVEAWGCIWLAAGNRNERKDELQKSRT